MFELLNPTRTKIVDVVVLSQKNRQPDDNPGAKISVEQQLHNDTLGYFDGFLRSFLYTKRPGQTASTQASLEGVAPVSDTPHLTVVGAKLGWFHWELELTGYELGVGHGIGGKSDLALADCVVSNFRFHANEGGTVDARYDIECQDASEKAFGRLAKLKSTEVDLVLRPPEAAQGEIETSRSPIAAWPRPPKDATDTFVEQHGKPAAKKRGGNAAASMKRAGTRKAAGARA